VVAEVGVEYPDVEVDDMLVDNAAMQLASDPAQFADAVAGALLTGVDCPGRRT